MRGMCCSPGHEYRMLVSGRAFGDCSLPGYHHCTATRWPQADETSKQSVTLLAEHFCVLQLEQGSNRIKSVINCGESRWEFLEFVCPRHEIRSISFSFSLEEEKIISVAIGKKKLGISEDDVICTIKKFKKKEKKEDKEKKFRLRTYVARSQN